MIILINDKGYRFTVDTATWFAAPCEDEDDYAALRNHCLAPFTEACHGIKRSN